MWWCWLAGYQTVFAQQKCIVKDSNGKTLFEAPKFHGLYWLDHELAQAMACPCLLAAEIHIWLGHISQKSMKQLLNNNMISGLEVNKTQNIFSCNVCIKSKVTCKPLSKESREWAKKLGDRVYSNVWGPSRHLTIDKKQYYVSFIDNYSQESVLYLMQTKDEVFLEIQALWSHDALSKGC